MRQLSICSTDRHHHLVHKNRTPFNWYLLLSTVDTLPSTVYIAFVLVVYVQNVSWCSQHKGNVVLTQSGHLFCLCCKQFHHPYTQHKAHRKQFLHFFFFFFKETSAKKTKKRNFTVFLIAPIIRNLGIQYCIEYHTHAQIIFSAYKNSFLSSA